MVATNGKRKKGQQRSSARSESLEERVPPVLSETVYADSIEIFEQAVARVFESRRDFYVHTLVSELRRLGIREVPSAENNDSVKWVGIDSLSKLRSLVGGRFQNIKAKWVGAGFPLKEHRGDKTESYALNQEGWIELTNWVMGQGFEARLADDSSEYLFEIRQLASSN